MKETTKHNLLDIIRSIKSKKIMVIGDLMLDHYVWGSVDRISQEAPIPIVRVEKEEYKLGGAANVAANVRALDCEVFPVGVIGTCPSADTILAIFQEKGISTGGVHVSESFQTIVKQRFLSNQQQLLRVDFEAAKSKEVNFEAELLPMVLDRMPEMDCVIIEDYAKGVITERLVTKAIDKAKKLDIPIICDPGKGVDFSVYKGITTIKPNRTEVEIITNIRLSNREKILEAAQILQEKCEADFLSISLDKDGILLYKDKNDYSFIETDAREIYDTTGGGDIVISMLAITLANKISPIMCARLANVAAELEMLHMGVVPIPWSEIEDHLNNDGLNRKIVEIPRLKKQLAEDSENEIIFTNGYFDNISARHLRFLLEIERFKGKLIIGINSDASILRQKGESPLINERDRARILASLENVYRVVIFDEDDATSIIKEIRPNIVIKGEDFKNKQLPETDSINEVGARVEYIQHF